MNIPGLLLSFVFPFAAMHLAVSKVNDILATLLLTTFMLVLLIILIPGQTLLPQIRILDTIIGAGLALAGVFVLWSSSHWKRPGILSLQYDIIQFILSIVHFYCCRTSSDPKKSSSLIFYYENVNRSSAALVDVPTVGTTWLAS